jgi:hypothetical protein
MALFAMSVCLGANPGRAQDSQTNLQAGSSADAQADENDSLEGVVLNNLTHEPISRALVASPDNRFATMTDGQGHFEFRFPKGGTGIANRPTALVARKPGYLSGPSPETELPASTKQVTLALTPEGLLIGHVSLPSSEAADRIQLQLYRRQVEDGRAHWVPQGQTVARSTGDFRFAELSPGTYKLMTLEQLDRDQTATPGGEQVYGFAPVYFPSAKTFAGAESIELAAGQTFQADLAVVRLPYFRVRVSVAGVLPTAGGISVSVAAGSQGPGYSLGYNLQTHTIEGALPQGVYSLEGLGFGPAVSVGESTLTVHDAPVSVGSMTMVSAQSIRVDVKEEFSSPPEIDDVENANLSKVSRSVSGPRSYLNVRLEPAEDFAQHGGPSERPPANARDESLVLDGVVPGRYWVHVDSSRGYASSVTSGGMDLLQEPLVVANGSSRPIEITMRDDTAQLEGTVEGADNATGDPNPFAHVYCVPILDSPGRFAEVATAPDGTFILPNLPPGTYRALAFKRAQPNLEFRNPEVMRAYESSGGLVHLTSGQKDHLTLSLVSKGSE